METNYDEAFSKYYDIINKDKSYDDEVAVIDSVIRKFTDKKNMKLADVGCGTGNHALEFSRMSYKVSGFDVSPHMIEIAQRKSNEVDFVCENFKDAKGVFDVIVSLFDVVNALGPYEKLIEFFIAVAKHMDQDSIFIFDVWNGDAVVKSPPEVKFKVIEKGDIKIERNVVPENDMQKQTSILTYDLKIYKNGKLIDSVKPRMVIHFFKQDEIISALKTAGLKIVCTFPYKEPDRKIKEDDWKINFVCKLK